MLPYWRLRKHKLNPVGCFLQVYGVLDVQRVAGNFHVSVHGLNIYVAQMVGISISLFDIACVLPILLLPRCYTIPFYPRKQIFGGSKNVNVSHMIHDLSFGPKYPGIHNPLDDTNRILRDTSGTFKYYIKVFFILICHEHCM